MRILVTRTLTLALALLLAADHTSVCLGWDWSADARMACCAEGEPCAMHWSHDSETTYANHQTQADACCAISEDGRSRESSPPLVVAPPGVSEPGVILTVRVPALVLSTRWTIPPIARAPVPRHLLLSVFLV